MEKKIEEMAQDIAKVIDDVHEGCRLTDCDLCVYNNKEQCKAYAIAEKLDLLGYQKQVQGEWKFYKVRSYGVSITHELVCNRCGIKVEMLQGRHYKYCPNCSAKMKGE